MQMDGPGQDASGGIFIELRPQKHSISACSPAGLFGVYAVADPHSDHEDLSWTIMNNITRMCYSVRALCIKAQ